MTSDERHGVWNHRQIDCLFNSLLRLTSKETTKLRLTGFLCLNATGHRWFPSQKEPSSVKIFHYNDDIMGAIASQITSLTTVYSTVNSGADQRKHRSSAPLAFVRGEFTGPFPAQMASNAENISIWLRHHAHVMTSSLFFSNCPAGLSTIWGRIAWHPRRTGARGLLCGYTQTRGRPRGNHLWIGNWLGFR